MHTKEAHNGVNFCVLAPRVGVITLVNIKEETAHGLAN